MKPTDPFRAFLFMLMRWYHPAEVEARHDHTAAVIAESERVGARTDEMASRLHLREAQRKIARRLDGRS